MPRKAAQKKEPISFKINLLPGREFERTQLGQFLKWALSVGRYIVIFTELIVILAFLARFKLDREISDLSEEIEQKKVIVESAKGMEEDYKELQFKIGQVKAIWEGQKNYRGLLEKLGVITPIDAVINSIDITGDSLDLKAEVFSDAGLATFIKEFKTSKYFSNVVLGTISKGEEKETGGFNFVLKAKLTEEGKKLGK